MVDNSWVDLEALCPIDLRRIHVYAKEFLSYIPTSITLENLEKSKESIFNARGSFDSMITTLIQLLYDREIQKEPEDKILFAWLVDNLGRFLKKLDEDEFTLIVKYDEPGEKSSVGISRISSYAKTLKTSADILIYESLLKATKEYSTFKDTDKIKKEPRIFLYILFQILQVTLSVLGGMTREKSGTSIGKKSFIQTVPISWQSLLSSQGQNVIKEGYKQDTGVDIDEFEDEMKEIDGGLEDVENY